MIHYTITFTMVLVVLMLWLIDTLQLRKERKCATPTEYRGFLTPRECAAVMRAARRQGLERSEVESKTGNDISRARTSYQTFLEHDIPAADAVVTKVERLLGVPRSKFESLQVVCYKKGQKYEAHYDSDDDTPAEEIRSDTVLIYLNTVDKGGHTRFPKAKVSVTPELGKAVHWKNTDSRGAILPCAYHAGMPVIEGTKWICTVWFRPG